MPNVCPVDKFSRINLTKLQHNASTSIVKIKTISDDLHTLIREIVCSTS